jgi:hypothetical protein
MIVIVITELTDMVIMIIVVVMVNTLTIMMDIAIKLMEIVIIADNQARIARVSPRTLVIQVAHNVRKVARMRAAMKLDVIVTKSHCHPAPRALSVHLKAISQNTRNVIVIIIKIANNIARMSPLRNIHAAIILIIPATITNTKRKVIVTSLMRRNNHLVQSLNLSLNLVLPKPIVAIARRTNISTKNRLHLNLNHHITIANHASVATAANARSASVAIVATENVMKAQAVHLVRTLVHHVVIPAHLQAALILAHLQAQIVLHLVRQVQVTHRAQAVRQVQAAGQARQATHLPAHRAQAQIVRHRAQAQIVAHRAIHLAQVVHLAGQARQVTHLAQVVHPVHVK